MIGKAEVIDFHPLPSSANLLPALSITLSSRLRELTACSYGVNLAAQPGEETSYRIDRAPDAACEGLE